MGELEVASSGDVAEKTQTQRVGHSIEQLSKLKCIKRQYPGVYRSTPLGAVPHAVLSKLSAFTAWQVNGYMSLLCPLNSVTVSAQRLSGKPVAFDVGRTLDSR